MIDTLHLFIIHAKSLTIRASRFQTILRTIDDISKNGLTVKTQFIHQHEPGEIQTKLEELNKLVSYDPIGDADFDNQRYMLSVPIISNIEKHKEAWRYISKLSESSKSLYLIIEDDALLFPECVNNLRELFQKDHSSWDMLSLGLSTTNAQSNADDFINFRDTMRVLPSKEAYCLKPQTAKLFLEQSTNYKFIMRLHLSYLIKQNPNLKVMFLKNRIFIDGSKLGIFPSSIHPTNILIFNSEFVQMHTYVRKTAEEVKKDFSKIERLYKTVENIHSPDAMHMYGILLMKAGRIKDAEEIFTEAIQEMKKQQGFLNNQSELANNLVDLYKVLQKDIDTCDIKTAKYSVHTLPDLIQED